MAKNNASLVSVIIPAYNYAHYLGECINSVLSQAGNDFDLEVIVVDDGSTDDTPAVAKQFSASIRYIRQDNQGLAATRNTGIKAATGKYMMFLDADDLLTPGVIKSHLENFAADPDLDISVCASLHFYPAGSTNKNTVWPLKIADLDLHLCHSIISPVHAFLLKREIKGNILYFDTGMKACEDNDYWLRCAVAGARFASTTDGLVLYRGHTSSMSKDLQQQESNGALLRQKKMDYLENAPRFPGCGKFLGWLAFASGMVRQARIFQKISPDRARSMLSTASLALLKSARHHKSEDHASDYLRIAAGYYAASVICSRQLFEDLAIPGSDRGFAFLGSFFPGLCALALPDLEKEKNLLYNRLCCSQDRIMATLRREMKRDYLLAKILKP